AERVEVGASPDEDGTPLEKGFQREDALLFRFGAGLHRLQGDADVGVSQHAPQEFDERRLLPGLLDDDFARRVAPRELDDFFGGAQESIFFGIECEKEMFATAGRANHNDSSSCAILDAASTETSWVHKDEPIKIVKRVVALGAAGVGEAERVFIELVRVLGPARLDGA